ncbi:MAG TPA: hydroxymethylbilane synthase [Candidatus Baltobacteraceae bacterium]|nr:hydroxymethylbilane synthase [Candidatus Baltobacteraceae bacterium]
MHDLAQAGHDVVVCASRASALAMTQTRAVAARLAQLGWATTILNITTTGDRDRVRSFAAIGSESLFVKELEIALRDGRAHYAVHSCKDLPSTLAEGMLLAAISQREDPRDAFCSERYERFEDLPAGAVVGSSSMRRRAQLMAMRPDLTYEDIRGNVDTRLEKLRSGKYDAIVLACAGLRRLNVSAKYMVPFEVTQMVPAVGQGALAVETLEGASIAQRLRDAVNDGPTELAVTCERAALAHLRGGCQAPIGVHAYFEGGELCAIGAMTDEPGRPLRRAGVRAAVSNCAAAADLGVRLAEQMQCA